jgi:hypothetical protein
LDGALRQPPDPQQGPFFEEKQVERLFSRLYEFAEELEDYKDFAPRGSALYRRHGAPSGINDLVAETFLEEMPAVNDVTAQRLARAQAVARAQGRKPYLVDLLRVGCHGRWRAGIRPAAYRFAQIR